jgi:hypothetical protein
LRQFVIFLPQTILNRLQNFAHYHFCSCWQELSASSCECDDTSSSSAQRRRRSQRRGGTTANHHRHNHRRSSHNNNNNNHESQQNSNSSNIVNSNSSIKVQCHSGRDSPPAALNQDDGQLSSPPGLSEAYRAMIGLAANAANGNRTPSIEQQSCCLTETTDCPSDASVITSVSTLHHHERSNNGGSSRRRNNNLNGGTAASAISPTASTASSCASSTASSSSASFSKQRRNGGGGQKSDRRGGGANSSTRLLLGGGNSGGLLRSQDFGRGSLGTAAAYSRSEEDLIQRLPDLSLGGASGGGAGGRVSLPPPVLRNLVRERLRADGISLSAHPYTQAVSSLPVSQLR